MARQTKRSIIPTRADATVDFGCRLRLTALTSPRLIA